MALRTGLSCSCKAGAAIAGASLSYAPAAPLQVQLSESWEGTRAGTSAALPKLPTPMRSTATILLVLLALTLGSPSAPGVAARTLTQARPIWDLGNGVGGGLRSRALRVS